MTLGEFYDRIKSYPGEVMDFTVVDVFSWRGIYSEPCCTLSTEKETKRNNLNKLRELITFGFYGWKGGYFEYTFDDTIHFESEPSDYTPNEGYLKGFLEKYMNDAVEHIFFKPKHEDEETAPEKVADRDETTSEDSQNRLTDDGTEGFLKELAGVYNKHGIDGQMNIRDYLLAEMTYKFLTVIKDTTDKEFEWKVCRKPESVKLADIQGEDYIKDTVKAEDCNPKKQPCVMTNRGLVTDVLKFDGNE